MNNVVNYLVESGISLALLSLIYLAFLRKETFFRTNRIFLLGSVVFSLFLPLFHVSLFPNMPVMLPEVTVTPYKNLIETVIVTGHGFTSSLESAVVSSMLAIYIYLSGVAIMTGLFIFRLIQLFNILKNGRVVPFNRGKMVLVKGDIVPFSFLNYLFLPENFEETPGHQRIITHEMEHISQRHTYDVLLCELLVILQWFNPFIWLLRREIRENHEYLADRGVLRSGVQPGEYKLLLLAQVAGPQIYVANHFNFSLLKSRMRMITRNRSSKAALTKTIFGLLMAAGLVVTFACERKEYYIPEETATTETTNDKEDEIFRVVDIMPVFPGGETAMRQYIARSVNYPVIARERGIQGKVFVSFVINKEGWVKDIKVVRSAEPSLDQEAIRAVMYMPQWEPGRHEGKPVQVAYTVPISFVLQ